MYCLISWQACHSDNLRSWNPAALSWWHHTDSAGRPACSGCTRHHSESAGASRWLWCCWERRPAWNTQPSWDQIFIVRHSANSDHEYGLTFWKCPQTGWRWVDGGVWAPPGKQSLPSEWPSGTQSQPSQGCSCKPLTQRTPEGQQTLDLMYLVSLKTVSGRKNTDLVASRQSQDGVWQFCGSQVDDTQVWSLV